MVEVTIYREVTDFPGYRVGSDGSLWTVRKPGPGGACYTEWRPKSLRARPDGYVWVNLVKGGRGYGRALHRLVLEAFVGPPPSAGLVCCHGNGVRSDNRIENLRWDTMENNLADRREHQTLPSQAGEENNAVKLSAADVRDIRRMREAGIPRKDVALRYGIHPVTVSQITRRKLWPHLV